MAGTSCTRTLAASAFVPATRRTSAACSIAGLYNEAQVSRKAGKGEDANRLMQMLVERKPNDSNARACMWAESLLLDRKDPAASLAALDSITVRPDDARLRPRRDMLAADALRQAGRTDSARVVTAGARDAVPGESAGEGEAGFVEVGNRGRDGIGESRTLGSSAVERLPRVPDSLIRLPIPDYWTISANPRCFVRTTVDEPFAARSIAHFEYWISELPEIVVLSVV